MRALLIPLVLMSVSGPAAAQTLTAECTDVKGRIIGIHGVLLGQKPVDDTDRMTGGKFTITWDSQSDTAAIVSQTAGAPAPLRETGKVAHVSDESVSFIVAYPAAVWLYTLFVKPKYLLLTSHSSGLGPDSGGAITKAFYARCNVTAR